MTLNDDVAQSISASSDVDDQLVLGDMADEDTFEIPLKTGYSHSNNFSELSEELIQLLIQVVAISRRKYALRLAMRHPCEPNSFIQEAEQVR